MIGQVRFRSRVHSSANLAAVPTNNSRQSAKLADKNPCAFSRPVQFPACLLVLSFDP